MLKPTTDVDIYWIPFPVVSWLYNIVLLSKRNDQAHLSPHRRASSGRRWGATRPKGFVA